MSGFRVLALLAAMLWPAIGAAADIPPGERRSGFDFMGRDTQVMQTDDTLNPGMLWVAEGEAQWHQAPVPGVKSCASCHGADAATLPGVAARYPAFDPRAGRPVNLVQRINDCRTRQQGQPAWAEESRLLLALAAYLGRQARGLPLASPDDPRLQSFRDNGRRLFSTPIGQLNFSCAQCHDDNWGKRLAGNPIPQAHPTGYPIYRLEWQDLGSLQRRLRNCMTGVRAEPYPYGAPELVDLELFLADRARGMMVETPAVRP